MRMKKLFKRENLVEYNYLIAYEQPLSFVTESFQKALINLEYVNIDGNMQVIQFTSSLSGAGKSTFVSNLAYLVGKKGKKVCLVDLDLRKPKINRVFQVPNEGGLTEYLAGKVTYEKLVQKSEKYGINFIVSGERTTAVVNVLEAQKLKDLIERLKQDFDYVIVDSPPVIAVSDALYIARIVDGVVFVVGQNEAKRSVINEAVRTLKQNNVNVIGSIFTQVDMKDSDLYSYTYGYGYGYLSEESDELDLEKTKND